MRYAVYVVPLILLLLFSFTSCKEKQYLNIGFYNVENLFDTLDNPHTRDNNFLPDGKKKWNSDKYWTKIDHIAQVIDSMPNLIFLGLCEVENKHVLADLKAHDRLSKKGYSIIHKDSPDKRGIDIAALYKADFFELIDYHYYPVKLPERKSYSTRDILYVKGLPLSKDTLHIFINHWPSRYGGEVKTRPDRMHVAKEIAAKIDSLQEINANAQCIVMGDLNDTPEDSSVVWLMQESKLINQGRLISKDIGTYSYKGSWDVLDHIMFTENLRTGKKLSIPYGAYQVYAPHFIMYQKKDGTLAPNRTFGYRYFGGYSDHLPVFIKINYK